MDTMLKYIFVNGLPMESYVANIFLRKKVIRKIVGDWAWERGRNKGLIDDSFDEFQLAILIIYI